MSDQFGNTVEGEIWVPLDEAEPMQESINRAIMDAYYSGYRAGQSDEHHRWSEALKRLIKERG